MTDKANRAALVTGGSRGIGLGIAQSLAKEGWNLAVNGIRAESQVQESLDRLREAGSEVIYCQGDVGQANDRQGVVQQTVERFGAIDLLVNNAGITSPGRLDILEATEEAWDKVMSVNLKGAFFLTQLVAQRMVEQHEQDKNFRGTIINISSISGEVVSVTRGDYCVSWAGMGAATKLWAARLAEYGVSVYEIRPGIIRTDMTAGVTEKYDKLIADGLTVENRWGTPEDVGRAVAALARRELSYATGNVLYVDGGLTLRRL